jgi:hypothetical protein
MQLRRHDAMYTGGMHASASKPLMILLALTLASCKNGGGGGGSVTQDEAPAAYAAQLCQLLEACGCSSPYPSTDQCIDAISIETETSFAEAEAAGLVYDPECMANYLTALDELGCATISELLEQADPETDPVASCKVLSGTATEGEACTSFYETVYGDSCAQGLFCAGDTCTNAFDPTVKQLGETCAPQSEICEDGTFCANSPETPDVYVCEDLPGEGESCMEHFLCEDGFGCDTSDYTCKGPVGPGEACDGFSTICQDGFFCESTGQTCVPLLAEGSACTSSLQCADGLQCEALTEGGPEVCTPEGPLVCEI